MATAAFVTLGCKVNQYETQKILESFEKRGFRIVTLDDGADVVVINSCSVTSIAESKSRYVARQAVRKNPQAKLVFTGCAAQMAINKGEEVAEASMIVANPEKMETVEHLLQNFPELASSVSENTPAKVVTNRTRATLKLQDGCNVLCSYCSIPFTRPGMSSRPASAVLDEAKQLVLMGHLEIVLTGVLIGAYGPATGSGGPNFEDIVEQISEIPGLARVRISSIEMRQVTPRLVRLIQNGKVVPHLHIPLQAGDTHVLRDMNRPYTQDEYVRLCLELRAQIPGLTLTTDILVGFPTETDERFLSTVDVCERVRFKKIHAFRFSPRYGTPADAFGDPISPQEKQRRSAVLCDLEKVYANELGQRQIGNTVEALVEGKVGKDGLLEGLTPDYFTVRFAGPQQIRRSLQNVRVDEQRDGVLIGEWVAAPHSDLKPLMLA